MHLENGQYGVSKLPEGRQARPHKLLGIFMANKIVDELLKSSSESNIDKAEFSQPLCTALQVLLVNLWKELGVLPDSVVGHSSGEIAAAYAAGAIDVEDAIIIAYMRGQATRLQTSSGAMAAVGQGAEWVRDKLPDGVVIACENSGSSTTVSGDREAVLSFIEKVKEVDSEVFVRLLRVEQAYHSRESFFQESFKIELGNTDQAFPF